MKTIDFNQYNEKLKINPINLAKFNDIKLNSNEPVSSILIINDIETYDIIKTKNGKYYMMMRKDFNYDVSFNEQLKILQNNKQERFHHSWWNMNCFYKYI